jgi:hypothetical protein
MQFFRQKVRTRALCMGFWSWKFSTLSGNIRHDEVHAVSEQLMLCCMLPQHPHSAQPVQTFYMLSKVSHLRSVVECILPLAFLYITTTM